MFNAPDKAPRWWRSCCESCANRCYGCGEAGIGADAGNRGGRYACNRSSSANASRTEKSGPGRRADTAGDQSDSTGYHCNLS